jgi:endonuclease-3
MPAMAIDTHIYRVCKRLGIIGPKVTADKAHDILEALVEPDQVYPFHLAFITHGRQVCKAQRPLCANCMVAWSCPSRDQFMGPADSPPAVAPVSAGRHATGATQLPHSVPAEEDAL